MSDAAPALRVSGLSRSFGRPAVGGLELEVCRGELHARPGSNGAGKNMIGAAILVTLGLAWRLRPRRP